jgi:predicted GTPase
MVKQSALEPEGEEDIMSMDSKKMDIAEQIREITNQFQDFISTEFTEFYTYFHDMLEENVINMLNIEKPRVMVYGIYNSGKSTLINALCREKVAETADRPMTDQISEYDRGDYYLVDSPGVDAPIQHEMVTEEHINKCHIILFVISSKGLFEDRANYEKLANLIKKDIPFVIVLNDRGYPIGSDWSDEQKKRAKFEHDQELNIIQYKIIQNLIKESNDTKITDQYEVIKLNAKKAWRGIEKNKERLYEASGVEFLETRIIQLLTSDTAMNALFKQPISNMKECLNEVEKIITQNMSGNTSEDFSMRLNTLSRKKDNIMEDLRILTQQAVQSHLDELTNSYVNGDADLYETIANTIFMDIDNRYTAKLNELLVFVDHNFGELNLFLDGMSNLVFMQDGGLKHQARGVELEPKENPYEKEELPKEKQGSFDFLKSRKKREKEKLERLEREAKIKNERAQYEVQENIRKKQEARQYASSDLDVLNREFNVIVSQGLTEKYDELMSQIQQVDCLNKQAREDGERQTACVRSLRNKLLAVENTLK